MTDPNAQPPHEPPAGPPAQPGQPVPPQQGQPVPPAQSQPVPPPQGQQAPPQQPYQQQPYQQQPAQPGQPYPPQQGYPQQGQPAPAAVPLTQADDNQWASLAHLGGILWILPPLIIWLVFKDRGPLANTEGKESVNFQITVTIGHIAIFIINLILGAVTLGFWALIGWIFPLALWVVTIIFCVQGFNKAKTGVPYRYPVALRLIK